MNVVCNNPVMYVVDYPAIESVEVIDKRRGRGALIRNGAARRTRSLRGTAHPAGDLSLTDLQPPRWSP